MHEPALLSPANDGSTMVSSKSWFHNDNSTLLSTVYRTCQICPSHWTATTTSRNQSHLIHIYKNSYLSPLIVSWQYILTPLQLWLAKAYNCTFSALPLQGHTTYKHHYYQTCTIYTVHCNITISLYKYWFLPQDTWGAPSHSKDTGCALSTCISRSNVCEGMEVSLMLGVPLFRRVGSVYHIRSNPKSQYFSSCQYTYPLITIIKWIMVTMRTHVITFIIVFLVIWK
jgi:hypothetical protein